MSEVLRRSLKLGDVADVIDPHPSHRAPPELEGGIPFVGIGDVSENGEIRASNARKVSPKILEEHRTRYEVSKGDIGYGRVATVGKVMRFGDIAEPFALSPTLALIKPKTIDASYLAHYLQSKEWDEAVAKLLTGTTRSSLGIQLLREIEVACPENTNIQIAIGQILDTLDTAIRETEALIDKLKAVKQGLLHDLLTRGIDANGQLRPPQSGAPQLYKESPLGWIPREWEVCPLYQQADVIDPQPDHRTPKEQEDGVPYVGIGDFDEHGCVCFSSCRRVVQGAFVKQRRRFEIEDGDIIYGKIGTIGKPKRLIAGDYALTANVLLLKPKSNPALFFMILSSAFERQILDITNTTSQPALGIETVRNLWVFKAPALENELISERLESLFSKISEETAMLHKLQQQKAGLMDDLLTGRVRVTPLLESMQQPAAQTGA